MSTLSRSEWEEIQGRWMERLKDCQDRANRTEDELRKVIQAYSFARSDLATACRRAIFELRELDCPARAREILEEVEGQGLTEMVWHPPTTKQGEPT